VAESPQLLVVDALGEMEPHSPESDWDRVASIIRGRLVAWEKAFLAAQTPATVRAVRSDWQVYVRWCEGSGTAPLPLDTTGLVAFLNAMVTAGKARSTVDRYLYTVRLIHGAAGLPDPAAHPHWKLEWKAVVRRLAEARRNAKKQAEPLKDSQVERILETLGNAPRDLRDAALIALASDTLCRESELVRSRREDLQPASDGVNWTLYVGQSKTDQEGIGAYRFCSRATKERIDRWCATAGITTGYLFLPLGGRPKSSQGPEGRPAHLRPAEVAKIFRRRACRAGLPGGLKMSGHSTRVGSAIDLLEGGASVTEAQFAGGWKTERMVQHYGKRALSGNNAMAKLRANRKPK